MSEDNKFAFTSDMLKEASEKMKHVETKERTAGIKQMWKCEDCEEMIDVDLPEEGKEDELVTPEHHGKPMKPFLTKE